MTVDLSPLTRAPGQGSVGRTLGAPLGIHVALLSVVLSLGVLVTHPGVPFFSDEGAAIIQARLLERTGRWVEANPLPSIDPKNDARTIPHADVGTKGRAPYGRHPLFPWVLEGADRIAGSSGFLVLTIASTVLAALGAALLARQLDRRLAVAALWLTGVGSPLVFDGGIVIAHTAAAALAAGAGLVLLIGLRSSGWRAICWAGALAALVGLCCALRTEGAIFGIAVTMVAGLAVVARWPAVRPVGAIASGLGSGSAVVAVRVIENVLAKRHFGSPLAALSVTGSAAGTGFVRGRLQGFLQTWFTTGYHPMDIVRLALIASVFAVAAAALLARRRRRADLVVFLLGLSAVALVVTLVAADPQAIPGLMIVFPAGWFALLAARRCDFPTTAGRVLASLVVLFTLGVLATTYRNGGGIEWGGRYFALGLPLAVPLAVLIINRRARELGSAASGQVIGFLTASSVLCAALAWIALAHGHALSGQGISSIEHAARVASPQRQPVVVTAEEFVPQIDWPHYLDYAWLVPPRRGLGEFTDRLAASGVPGIVLVTSEPATDVPGAAGYVTSQAVQVPEFRVNTPPRPGPITVAVMRPHS